MKCRTQSTISRDLKPTEEIKQYERIPQMTFLTLGSTVISDFQSDNIFLKVFRYKCTALFSVLNQSSVDYITQML